MSKMARRTVRLDAAEIMDIGIPRLERMKRMARGRLRLRLEMNVHELRRVTAPVTDAIETAQIAHAVKTPGGIEIPYFVPDGHDQHLDFSRYIGAFKGGQQYAAGSIVTYADGFYEAEDVTGERPPGTTWTRIGTRGRGYFTEDPEAFRDEVDEIKSETFDVELYMISEARFDAIDFDEVWLPVVELDDEGDETDEDD